MLMDLENLAAVMEVVHELTFYVDLQIANALNQKRKRSFRVNLKTILYTTSLMEKLKQFSL
jgi:hypothetical protein